MLHKRPEVLKLVVVLALLADIGADRVLRPAARAGGVVFDELVLKGECAVADASEDWHRVSIWMPLEGMSVQPGLVCVLFEAPDCRAMVFACRTQAGALNFLMSPMRTKDC